MKFHSQPIEEHQEVPLADEGQFERVVAHWADRHANPTTEQNRSYVVSVGEPERSEGLNPTGPQGPREAGRTRSGRGRIERQDAVQRAAQLAEILALVQAQGDEVVGHQTLRRLRPDPKTYLGRGAAAEIAARARECNANLLTLDAELSPSQARNLEDVAGIAVCDREAVILNVFLRHARTARARIQVEIAQLEYLRPRIRGLGLDMDQQAGGLMRARGPGETASELLARQLDGRLAELRKQLARLERSGTTQRKARREAARIVLVGYTNAGKTSLMNALTDAGLSAKDVPFETLDTTSRCLTRHGGDVIVSDTVGFIRRLPSRLLASFESTLAEIAEASLLVITLDASDPELDMHVETTEAQIARLGAAELPRFYVFNKIDRLEEPRLDHYMRMVSGGHPHAAISTHDREAVARLREALIHAARGQHQQARVFIPYAATDAIDCAYAECRVLEADAVERGLVLTLEGQAHVVARLQRAVKEVR